MFNFVFVAAAAVLVAAIVALPMSLMEWMDKNNRTFFFVKWYRIWSKRKGESIVADAKASVSRR